MPTACRSVSKKLQWVPTGYWWDYVKVRVGVSVCKLLGSIYNPNPNLTLTINLPLL